MNIDGATPGFNAEPDYPFWREKDVWLLPDAAKLICGRDPLSRYPGRPLYNVHRKVIDIIDTAFEAARSGELGVIREALLPNHILLSPYVFLTWAKGQGLEVPPFLEDILVTEPLRESLELGVKSEAGLRARARIALKVIRAIYPGMGLPEVVAHPGMKAALDCEDVPEGTIARWLDTPEASSEV